MISKPPIPPAPPKTRVVMDGPSLPPFPWIKAAIGLACVSLNMIWILTH